MIDLRVDVQLPFTVTDGALVILVRQEDGVVNFFFLPTDQGQDADGIHPGRGFNLGEDHTRWRRGRGCRFGHGWIAPLAMPGPLTMSGLVMLCS